MDVEIEEGDGRWIAGVAGGDGIPGTHVYGDTVRGALRRLAEVLRPDVVGAWAAHRPSNSYGLVVALSFHPAGRRWSARDAADAWTRGEAVRLVVAVAWEDGTRGPAILGDVSLHDRRQDAYVAAHGAP